MIFCIPAQAGQENLGRRQLWDNYNPGYGIMSEVREEVLGKASIELILVEL